MRRAPTAAAAVLLAGLGGLFPNPLAAGCVLPDAGMVMHPQSPSMFSASLRTSPSPVTVGVPFVVDLTVCSAEGARVDRLTIDATMPAHRHGMNYKPEIVAKGPGNYEGRGFLFHMPGRWEIALAVYTGETPTYLTLGVVVK